MPSGKGGGGGEGRLCLSPCAAPPYIAVTPAKAGAQFGSLGRGSVLFRQENSGAATRQSFAGLGPGLRRDDDVMLRKILKAGSRWRLR